MTASRRAISAVVGASIGQRTGGAGGIRTHDPTFTGYAISNRAPSTTRTPLRDAVIIAHSNPFPASCRPKIAYSSRTVHTTFTQLLQDPNTWIGLLSLTLLEIVLGIDNIVFISILAGKLPKDQQVKARQLGLGLAVITRIIFLLSIGWIMSLEKDLFNLIGQGISGRDLILILGGLFLIGKATHEIHGKLEGEEHVSTGAAKVAASMGAIIAQILVIDLVFSIDSVITAVGMVKHVEIMIAAVIISVIFMLVFVGKLSDFVDKHPTVKILALAFLVLIGGNLLAEGFGQHVPKAYTYFAMAFSVVVELINIKVRGKAKVPPVELRHNYPDGPAPE